MKTFCLGRMLAALLLVLCGAAAQAAVSCNVSARNLGELYDATAPNGNSVQGDLRISCTRSTLSDPSTVFYTIKTDFGQNSTGGVTRRVKDPVSNTFLFWILRNSVGPLGCGNSTNWGDAGAGLLTGNLSFAASALATNAIVPNAYCMRVRGTAGGNPAAPAAGTYVDTVTLVPDMSTTGLVGPYNVTAPNTQVTFSVGVGAQCVVRKQGDDLSFNYTAFGAAQFDVSNFQAVCSNGLPYSLTVAPATGTIAGINYTVTRVGALNRNGTGNQQAANVRVDIAGGQAGSCASSNCTGTAVHTVTLTY